MFSRKVNEKKMYNFEISSQTIILKIAKQLKTSYVLLHFKTSIELDFTKTVNKK